MTYQQYEGYIFDLDGTLYDTKGMDEANYHALSEAVAVHQQVSLEDAIVALKEAVGSVSDSGGRRSVYGAALDLGVPDRLIEEWQRRIVNPHRLIRPDPLLSRLLEEIALRAKLALLTNTRTLLAKRALSALGVGPGTFSEVRGGDRLISPKPSAEDVYDICRLLDIDPRKTISIGDRWNVDLAPALAVGLMVRKIRDRDDLVIWLEGEVSANRGPGYTDQSV